jgi:hypothetical protein
LHGILLDSGFEFFITEAIGDAVKAQRATSESGSEHGASAWAAFTLQVRPRHLAVCIAGFRYFVLLFAQSGSHRRGAQSVASAHAYRMFLRIVKY